MFKEAAIVIALIASAGGVWWYAIHHAPGSRATSREDIPFATEGGQELAPTVGSLIDNYAANEVAADHYYKGKRFRVTGVVRYVTRDDDGPLAVMQDLRETDKRPVTAQAHLTDDAAALPLTAGSVFAIECVGAGMSSKGVELVQCEGAMAL